MLIINLSQIKNSLLTTNSSLTLIPIDPPLAPTHELLIWGRFYRNTPQDTMLAR
jgi:hypothetical protein